MREGEYLDSLIQEYETVFAAQSFSKTRRAELNRNCSRTPCRENRGSSIIKSVSQRPFFS